MIKTQINNISTDTISYRFKMDSTYNKLGEFHGCEGIKLLSIEIFGEPRRTPKTTND